MPIDLAPEAIGPVAGGLAGACALAKLIYNDWSARAERSSTSRKFASASARMDDLAKKQASQDTSLLAYMLEAEKTYARESAMQQSLAGVHNAMDNLRRELSGDMRTISNDIKVLIEKVAANT
jgi:hypothetical protein